MDNAPCQLSERQAVPCAASGGAGSPGEVG